MEEKLNTVSITSRIKSIKLDEFIITENAKKLKVPINIESLSFDLSVNVKVEPLSKTITVISNSFVYSDLQRTETYCKFSSTGVFHLLNFEEIAKQFNNSIPNFIASMFAGVLISSTRGMAILKSEGTVLEGFILPIIDPTTLFKQEGINPPEKKS